MSVKRSKIRRIGITIVGVLFLFLILAKMISGIFGIEPVRLYTEKRISEIIKGKFSCKDAQFLFFPRPHLSFSAITAILSDHIGLRAQSVALYPELLPLLKGKIRPFRLGLVRPDLRILRPIRKIGDGEKEEESTAHFFKRELERVIDINKASPLDLEIVIEKGRFSLPGKTDLFFRFRHIEMKTRLSHDQFEIDVHCGSNLFKRIEFKSVLNLNTMNGSGKMALKGLTPRTIVSDLFQLKEIQTDDTKIDLLVDFSIRNLTDIRATLKSSLPGIILKQMDKKSEINGKYIDGSLKIADGIIEVILNELSFDHPRLDLSGKLIIDLFTSDMTLEITGKNIDVSSTRETSLFLFGHNPVVNKICSIVLNGIVPEITVSSSGKTIKALGKLSNMKIKGRLMDGEVLVPKVNLFLSKVNGDVVISEGILYGKNLEAFLDNARGCDGSLKLGLFKQTHVPFSLDLFITADLSDLPSVLGRLIKNGKFKKEMRRIHKLEGEARGYLALGESLDRIRATVDVLDFFVTDAFYDRIPFTLNGSGARFFYENRHIDVSGVTGHAGDSSVSDLSFSIDWKEKPVIQVLSGPADLNMESLYPYLVSFHPIKRVCEGIKYVKGNFCLHSLEMNGPVLSPKKWAFDILGTPVSLEADAFFVNTPLMISQGVLTIDENNIDFEAIRLNSKESTLTGKGQIHAYLKGAETISLNATGNLGKDDFSWLAGIARIPERMTPKGPFGIIRGEIAWERKKRFSLFSEMNTKTGVNVTIDLTKEQNSLSIQRLLIKDEESDVSVSYSGSTDEKGLSFFGRLTQKTVNRLFETNAFLDGEVMGDFSLAFNKKRIEASYARGSLKGTDFTIPLSSDDLTLNCFSISSEKNGFRVVETDLFFLENQALVQGSVHFSEEGFLTDLSVVSDTLDLKRLIDRFKTDREMAKKNDGDKNILSISGKVDVTSKEAIYGKRSYTGFHSTLLFNKEGVKAFLHGSELCGIAVQGTIDLSPERISFHVTPLASHGDLNQSLNCLSGKKVLLEGKFDLSGDVEGVVEKNNKIQITQGNLAFHSVNGRIFNFVILAKIFSVLNVADMLRGDFPDLVNEGFPYRSITIKGYFKSGKFILEEAVIDNASMGITAKGEVSLEDMTLNLTILIAPFKTIDLVIRHIPLVNEILGGTLVSIPVKVTGSYSSPKTTFLEPSAVEAELIGLMERTFKLPFTLIKPIFSED